MDGGRLFTAIGLVRLARPGGFCPACRVLMKVRDARPELAKPMVAALVVLAVAGIHSVSPIKRASQARCRELCALHGPLPFNLMRSAAVVGARYGLSCLGCSAALMVAMVLIGMSSLWWGVILGIVVLTYKLAPPLRLRYELLLSLALMALAVAYLKMA